MMIGELGRAIRHHHLVQVRYKGEHLKGEPYPLTLCPRSGVLSLVLHAAPYWSLIPFAQLQELAVLPETFAPRSRPETYRGAA